MSRDVRSAGLLTYKLATPPITLGENDSVTVALAFITAQTKSAFAAAADDARRRWIELTGITDGEGEQAALPDFHLSQNYPNPFNAATTIPVDIRGAGTDRVRLEIYDILGRRVRTLIDAPLTAGVHLIPWDGTDHNGRPAASGVYLARLMVGEHTETRRMVLLK